MTVSLNEGCEEAKQNTNSKINVGCRVKYKCAQIKEEIYAKHVHKNVDCAR